jgi:hypothetical protein
MCSLVKEFMVWQVMDQGMYKGTVNLLKQAILFLTTSAHIPQLITYHAMNSSTK